MSLTLATKPEKFLHGCNGQISVTVSAVETELEVTDATWTYEVTEEDITHSGANGWFVPLAGIRKITGTLTFVYDIANSPFASPYGLKAAKTANLKLYQDAKVGANLDSADVTTPANVWAGPAFIKNFKPKGVAPKSGPQECTVDFSNSGPWTGPGI